VKCPVLPWLFNAIKRITAGEVKTALLGVERFDGLQYGFSFDANGDGHMEASIIGIHDGRFVSVGR
jgi:hypothetical protein